MKLLLIEDNQFDAELFQRAVDGLGPGWEVATCESYETALPVLEAGKFDVVAVDLTLPGFSAMQNVSLVIPKLASVLPVIVYTGSMEPTYRAACVAAGAVEFIQKGFSDSDMIRNAVRYATQVSQQRRFRKIVDSMREVTRQIKELYDEPQSSS